MTERVEGNKETNGDSNNQSMYSNYGTNDNKVTENSNQYDRYLKKKINEEKIHDSNKDKSD